MRRFLECVGQQEALINASYFQNNDIITQRVVCMDAARQALYTLVTTENVRIELESDVSSIRPSKKGLTVPKGTDGKTVVSDAISIHNDAAVDNDIKPSDSVSQVVNQHSDEEDMVIAPENDLSEKMKARSSPKIEPSFQPRDPSGSSRRDVGSEVSSVLSRHNFENVSPNAVASSRDSSVSIGVKRLKSPIR